MKKPPKHVGTVMVSFRADLPLAARLRAVADRDDRKLADTVRRLVIRALNLKP